MFIDPGAVTPMPGYRLKVAAGTPVDRTIEDRWHRVARALAAVKSDTGHWEQPFHKALRDFRFRPAGRIMSGPGTARRVYYGSRRIRHGGATAHSLAAGYAHRRCATRSTSLPRPPGFRPLGSLLINVACRFQPCHRHHVKAMQGQVRPPLLRQIGIVRCGGHEPFARGDFLPTDQFRLRLVAVRSSPFPLSDGPAAQGTRSARCRRTASTRRSNLQCGNIMLRSVWSEPDPSQIRPASMQPTGSAPTFERNSL